MSDDLFAGDGAARPFIGPERTPPSAPSAALPNVSGPTTPKAGNAIQPDTGTAEPYTAKASPGAQAGPHAAAVRETARPWRDGHPPADDDSSVELGWPEDADPEQWPLADVDPNPDLMPPPVDDYVENDEPEQPAWLAAMPAEVREDYLAGPYTGAGEAIPVGFTHRDPGGPPGVGFAAGGALDGLGPGPWLARALTDATAAGHDDLGESELIGVLLGCQRQVAWSQARLAAAVSALASRRRAQSSRPGWSQLSEHIADELAVAMRLTSRSASRMLDVASGLARLTEVAAALEAGVLDWPKACLFVDELAVLSDEEALAIAARLLHRAGEQTTGQLRAALARAVLAADPAAAERRRRQGRKDTRIEVWHEPSGNAALAGRELAPADAIAADAALTADADWLRDNGAAGTLAELRAAAYLARLSGRDLADLLPRDDTADSALSNAASAGSPASPAGADADSAPGSGSNGSGGTRPRGSIHLTMPLATLAGLTDAPGEVAGYGPADAATCRDLTAQIGSSSRWCLTLTDSDGRAVGHACAARRGPTAGQPLINWAAGLRDKLQLLESGPCRHTRQSGGYAWPASLRHLIEVRQRTCAAPGCRRPATRCDIDHTIPFESGGPTCECNGSPLCRRHHRCKQVPGWRLTQDQPGVMIWKLPSGRIYRTTGPPYAA
jgi:hypothetical protein